MIVFIVVFNKWYLSARRLEVSEKTDGICDIEMEPKCLEDDEIPVVETSSPELNVESTPAVAEKDSEASDATKDIRKYIVDNLIKGDTFEGARKRRKLKITIKRKVKMFIDLVILITHLFLFR